MEHIWSLYEKQDRKCILSGQNILFSGYTDKEQTASIDRIDSSKGYIEGNVQLVHKDINIIKWDFTNEEFIRICRLVSLYNETL